MYLIIGEEQPPFLDETRELNKLLAMPAFMATTSAFSAQLVAVATLVTYDM